MLIVAASACSPADAPAPAVGAAQPKVEDLRLPSPTPAAQPDLVTAPDGALLLSWVEPMDKGGHRLHPAQ